MEHNYTRVDFDGKQYRYVCDCGHAVVTKDGKMPIKVTIKK